jgi:DNA-binding response OmpR family regulator
VTDLTATERRLYDALYAAGGTLVTRRDLLAALFGASPEYDASQRAELKVYVHRLRRQGIEITNIKGVGYMLGSTRCPTCGQERGQ